jgi:autotransporter-associated beta strand protein
LAIRHFRRYFLRVNNFSLIILEISLTAILEVAGIRAGRLNSMVTFRTLRKSMMVLPLLLGSAIAPTIQAGKTDDPTMRPSMEWSGSDDFQFANRAFSASSRLFYAGPQWFLNALPGSTRAHTRYFLDQAGDPADSYTPYNSYVGTLRDVFDAGLFNVYHGSTSAGPSASKISNPLVADAGGPGVFYLGTSGNWDGPGAWGGPGTLLGNTYPDAPGATAADFQVVAGATTQNIVGGVTVGTIENLPTTPGNSAQSVSWTITTAQPITLDSGSAAAAQINNSQAVGTSSLTINGTTNGLRLASNLSITNVNPGGLITITAPISDVATAHTVTINGPGTTILSGSNTYAGGTTVASGTLLVNNSSGSSGTGSGTVLVNSGGTLGGDGFINGGTVTMNGTITGGTNGTIGTLTLTVPALDFGSASIFQVDIGPASADRLTLLGAGAFNITSGATINFTELSGGPTASSYTLATYGSWNGVQFLEPTLPAGYDLVYGTDSLTLVLVPEPATWIGAALALAAIGFTQRKRFAKRVVS